MKTLQKSIDCEAAFFDQIGFEPRAYLTADVDYNQHDGPSKALRNIEFAVIINGVEVDITDAVHKQLKRPINTNKWFNAKMSALDEITDDEIIAEFAPDDADYSPFERD